MLIFSKGIIKADKSGKVQLWGILKPYQSQVAEFMRELELRDVTIRYRDDRFVFSKNVDASRQQRMASS